MREWLEDELRRAIVTTCEDDTVLFGRHASERSIMFRIGRYLAPVVEGRCPGQLWVDCEYNRIADPVNVRVIKQPEAWITPHPVRELRELTRYRVKLVRARTSCKDQVHAVLAKLGIPVACSDIFGEHLAGRHGAEPAVCGEGGLAAQGLRTACAGGRASCPFSRHSGVAPTG